MVLARRRVEIKRIRTLIRQGMLGEAAAALRDREIQHHRDGCQLVSELVAALCERAASYIAAGRYREAADDVELAGRFAGNDARVVDVLDRLTQAVRDAADAHLKEGEPELARALLDELALRGITSPSLVRLRQIVKLWLEARQHRRAERFHQARLLLEQALARLPGNEVVRRELNEVDGLARRRTELENQLVQAYRDGDWFAVKALAEQLESLAPAHWLAAEARRRAWHEIGGSLCVRAPGQRMAERGRGQSAVMASRVVGGVRPAVWQVLIDGGGSYLLTTSPAVSFGHQNGDADIRLLANIRGLHFRIERDREGYVLVPVHPVVLNGRQVISPAPLRHGAQIEAGTGVRFTFRVPSRLSATALLVPEMRSVLRQRVDAIVLVAKVCVGGDDARCHLYVPSENRLTLVVTDPEQQRFLFRTDGEFCVDGRPCKGEEEFIPPARIELPDTRIVFAPA